MVDPPPARADEEENVLINRFLVDKKAPKKKLEAKFRPKARLQTVPRRMFRRMFRTEGEPSIIGEDYADELVSIYSLLRYHGVSGFVLKDEADTEGLCPKGQ